MLIHTDRSVGRNKETVREIPQQKLEKGAAAVAILLFVHLSFQLPRLGSSQTDLHQRLHEMQCTLQKKIGFAVPKEGAPAPAAEEAGEAITCLDRMSYP